MSADILIRLADIDAESALLTGQGDTWLSTGERARLARMRSPKVRRRFQAGHWLARRTLAAFAGGAPEDWSLRSDDNGAPLATHADGRVAPRLSISHSGDLLVCAVAAGAVGVDVEAPTRPRDLARLASMVFSGEERAALQALGPDARHPYFYTRWTLREAWLKRGSRGLAPARMRGLRLHPTDADATAWTWRGKRAWLALCADPGVRVTLDGTPPFSADSGWRIEEG